MKNSSRKVFTLLILFVSVLIFSMLAVTAAVANTHQTDKTTDNVQIEAKYKTASTKITFNANGGKIGQKNTLSLNVKKGTKIKKFPATPKRSGHTFKGWYTKKSGGTKISVNTKPSKSVTYFAQWKKTSSKENSKIVGGWIFETSGSNKYSYSFSFKNDGTFFYSYKQGSYTAVTTGKYKVSNEKIFYSNIIYNNEKKYTDTVSEYKFGKDTVGEFLLMPSFKYDESYVDISRGVKFRKF